MKRLLAIITALIFVQNASAQISVHDSMLDTLFAYSVKSCDEFLSRFNGEETAPGISMDEAEYRERNILALFEKERLIEHQNKYTVDNQLFRDITAFIKYVCGKNIQIKLTDGDFFAAAYMKAKFQGKEKKICIALKYENTGNDIFRWAIAGASGLIENKMIDTAQNGSIRPVDHEVNFMQLKNVLNMPDGKVLNFRSNDTDIDQLSYLSALINTKQITFMQCDSVVFHCLSVKDYLFKVSKFNRKDYNTGWLISDFQKINAEDKQKYINQLLGKK